MYDVSNGIEEEQTEEKASAEKEGRSHNGNAKEDYEVI